MDLWTLCEEKGLLPRILKISRGHLGFWLNRLNKKNNIYTRFVRRRVYLWMICIWKMQQKINEKR